MAATGVRTGWYVLFGITWQACLGAAPTRHSSRRPRCRASMLTALLTRGSQVQYPPCPDRFQKHLWRISPLCLLISKFCVRPESQPSRREKMRGCGPGQVGQTQPRLMGQLGALGSIGEHRGLGPYPKRVVCILPFAAVQATMPCNGCIKPSPYLPNAITLPRLNSTSAAPYEVLRTLRDPCGAPSRTPPRGEMTRTGQDVAAKLVKPPVAASCRAGGPACRGHRDVSRNPSTAWLQCHSATVLLEECPVGHAARIDKSTSRQAACIGTTGIRRDSHAQHHCEPRAGLRRASDSDGAISIIAPYAAKASRLSIGLVACSCGLDGDVSPSEPRPRRTEKDSPTCREWSRPVSTDLAFPTAAAAPFMQT